MTKVRCKPRQSWFNTSPDHLQSTHQGEKSSFDAKNNIEVHRLVLSFLSLVDGTNRIRSSPLLKTNINGIRMKHSLEYVHELYLVHSLSPIIANDLCLFDYSSNQNENMNVQAHSYDFLQLNCDHHTMKTNEAIVSPLLKTNNTFDKGIII